MRALYYEALLGRPDVDDGEHCANCGRAGATNLHHVIPKGMGGVTREMERLIPKIRLCGSGNLDGCHGLVHAKLLHINWADALGGWCRLLTREPMGDPEAWEAFSRLYGPLLGWAEAKRWGEPIGGRA